MNAVRAYFNRGWRIDDMKNTGYLYPHAHKHLKYMYCTLFCALLSSTVGSSFHYIWNIGGLFTLLIASGTIFFLFTKPPSEIKKRVCLLITGAFFIGASIGPLTKYLFGIDQGFVINILACTTIDFGTFWVRSLLIRDRSLCNCWWLVILMFFWFAFASDIFGGHSARWMVQVWSLLALYMLFISVYSKEVMNDSLYGDVDYVNHACTNLFHLPAVMVHFVRVQVAAMLESFNRCMRLLNR
ncbi:bax inhibitor 1-like [Solanum pennellii]|uniref:Bax inhibitor 1-like n=1 Tax=Solanum pennellii TaxID=28526 RepID=A0ABM1HPX3_SOLPN|nr:bax inhibitor 1-like [Solanum pennellii]